MYSLINKNIFLILDNIERDQVAEYDWLSKSLKETNVSLDPEFQKRYKSYWAMDFARLSPDFCDFYFRVLEKGKSEDIEIRDLCQRLYEVPTHKNEQKTIQFSFAIKLAHMIDPALPIYDNLVCSFYFLKVAWPKGEFSQRIESYLSVYKFLLKELERIKINGLMESSIYEFRKGLSPKCFTDEKIIDTLIRSFVNIAKKGAFQTGDLEYH
jgi:hypothetical protein